MNSHFFEHIADQQIQHYVPAAYRAWQSSHLIPKPRSLEQPLGHAQCAEVACIAYSVVVGHSPGGIAQVQEVASTEMELCRPGHDLGMTVHVEVPETTRNAGNPEANLELAGDLGYMQDE